MSSFYSEKENNLLKNISARPRNTWYYPKAINDVDKIIDALIAIQKLEGKRWTKSTRDHIGTQTKLQQILKDEGIYGGTPSDMAGRNWMATFQFFGLAYVDQKDKKIRITPAGKALATTKDRNREIKEQMLKLQFPNPYQIKSMSGDIQMAPFWTTLKLIEKVEYLTQEEHAYFLMWIKNESEIDEVARQIVEFRKSGKHQKLPEKTATLLRDIGGRIRLYNGYTELLLDDESRKHAVTFNPKKITEIKKILNKKPSIDKNFLDKKTWNEWFEYYGARTQPRRIITGVQTAISYRAGKLDNFLNDCSTKNKLKINISKIEDEIHIKLKDIKKILNSNKLKSEFPIFEQTTISGNDVVISTDSQKTKKPGTNTKFSKKVDGFRDIIEDATRSDDYDKFEQDVGEIFQALGFKVEQLGTTKVGTAVTDVIIKSEQSKNPGDYWACLIDAKARVHGFEIETGSRRAMKEYFEKYQETVSGNNPFPAKSMMFVSSKFNGDVENKLNKMKKESKVDCCCISAENLLYLLDRYLSIQISHEKLLSLFKSNKEITRIAIDNL